MTLELMRHYPESTKFLSMGNWAIGSHIPENFAEVRPIFRAEFALPSWRPEA
jgi:hypothetical protein